MVCGLWFVVCVDLERANEDVARLTAENLALSKFKSDSTSAATAPVDDRLNEANSEKDRLQAALAQVSAEATASVQRLQSDLEAAIAQLKAKSEQIAALQKQRGSESEANPESKPESASTATATPAPPAPAADSKSSSDEQQMNELRAQVAHVTEQAQLQHKQLIMEFQDHLNKQLAAQAESYAARITDLETHLQHLQQQLIAAGSTPGSAPTQPPAPPAATAAQFEAMQKQIDSDVAQMKALTAEIEALQAQNQEFEQKLSASAPAASAPANSAVDSEQLQKSLADMSEQLRARTEQVKAIEKELSDRASELKDREEELEASKLGTFDPPHRTALYSSLLLFHSLYRYRSFERRERAFISGETRGRFETG